MSDAVALVTVEDIARKYDFGPQHPLRPERVLLTYDHILAIHDAEFVNAVRDIDGGLMPSGAGLLYGLGTPDNPVFSDMHNASAAVCGASIVAAELVANGDALHSFNPA